MASKTDARDARVVRENFISDGQRFDINDVVFVTDEDVPEGIKRLGPQRAAELPPGYLEPAVSAEVQSAAVTKATGRLEQSRKQRDAAKTALEVAESEAAASAERRELDVKQKQYQLTIAEQALEKEEELHGQVMDVFGVPVAEKPIAAKPVAAKPVAAKPAAKTKAAPEKKPIPEKKPAPEKTIKPAPLSPSSPAGPIKAPEPPAGKT